MKIPHRLILGTAVSLLLAFVSSGCNREAKAERKLTLAQAAYAKKDYATAEIEFKNVLELEPNHPKALKGLGLIWVRQGAMLDGARMLGGAKSKYKTDDEVGLGYAMALLDLGFIPDCRTELLEVLDRSPGNGEALILLAESSFTPEALTECVDRIAKSNAGDQVPALLASALIQLRRGESEAGAKTVEKVLKLDPNCARALALQGHLFGASKQPDKALESMKKAAEIGGPRSPENVAYVRFLMGQGKQDEAAAVLKAASGSAPDYLPTWRLLAHLSIAGKKDKEAAEYLAKVFAKSPLDMEAGLLQSDIWIRAKEPKKSSDLLEKISASLPGRPIIETSLSKAYLEAGNFRKAAETLDRLVAAYPGAIEAVLLRSGLFLKDGQPAEAIRLAEPLYKAQPKNRMLQNLMANAYNAANRPDDAAAIINQQVAGSPNDPGPQFKLGQLLRSQGKLPEARAAFESALKLAPEHLGVVSQLVAMDQADGKSDAALARVNAYIAAHSDVAQAYLLKAGLCYARKDFKDAEAAAEKAIELNPADSSAYGLLVRIQIDGGRSEEAAARLKQLVEKNPANSQAWLSLGSLQLQLGRNDEAKASFREVVKTNPEFAPAYNNLAYLESLAGGNTEQAMEFARKARSLAPSDPSIGDTLGWLEWQRGNFREALPLLVDAASQLPESAPVLYHLAMAHYMMLQSANASASLEKALAMKGAFPEKAEAEVYLATLRNGEQMDLATLETRVKEKPRDVVLKAFLAKKLAAAGRAEDSLATYQAALAINPDLETAYLGQAELYATALKQPDKALEAANQARKVAPQSAQAAAMLGSLSLRAGKCQEAYDLLQEAARKLPDDVGVQYDAAWAAYSMGRVGDARSAMEKVAAADASRSEAVREFLTLTAEAPAERAMVDSVLAKTPGHVPALMASAAIRQKAGESPVETYEKVLGLYPQFDPARIALARIYLANPEKLQAAEKLATEARERLKNDPELGGILGLVNFRKGQFDMAVQLLKELSAHRSLNGTELFALGVSQASTKRPEDARKHLTEALKSNLPEADAAKAKATLEELDKADSKE